MLRLEQERQLENKIAEYQKARDRAEELRVKEARRLADEKVREI